MHLKIGVLVLFENIGGSKIVYVMHIMKQRWVYYPSFLFTSISFSSLVLSDDVEFTSQHLYFSA